MFYKYNIVLFEKDLTRMIFDSQVKKINYCNCDKDGHESQPLSRVCVDPECPSKSLICSICEQVDHKSHKTVPLKVLLNKVSSECSFQKAGVNPLYFTSIIDKTRANFFTVLKQTRKEINQFLEDLQAKGKIYFNRLEQVTMSLIQIENPIKYLNGSDTKNSKRLKDYFGKILGLISYDQKTAFSLDNKLEELVDGCKKKNKEVEVQIDLLRKQMEKCSNKMVSLLDTDPLPKSSKLPSFFWSQQFKGAKVKVNDNIAQQTAMESSGQRFAMMQPSLNEIYNKKKLCWGIKIKKFSGWIGVGICLKNVIKKANYQFNYTNIGHGSYLISSNGYSWSHSVKEFNSAFKTFQFNINDIIYMEYDPKGNKLWFMKNLGPEKFQLVCDPAPVGDYYNPCVNLCSTGDSVEIINPGVPITL